MEYEIWEERDEEGEVICNTFLPAGPKNDFWKEDLANSKLIHIIEASNSNEAMTKYYEYMGWDPYVPKD